MVHRALLLLRKIPKCKVTTYKVLAEKCKTSPRAIGQIMKYNRRPERYPCYKVIKSSGEIGGYCGNKEKDVKKKILSLKKDGIKIKNGKIDKKYFHHFT